MRVDVRLSAPLASATPSPPLDLAFDTERTVCSWQTSVERGCESATVGYADDQRGGFVVTGLPEAIQGWQEFAHVELAVGGDTVWEGRAGAPKFLRGQIQGFSARGYWDALSDHEWDGANIGTATTGPLMQMLFGIGAPYLTVDGANWRDPGILWQPSTVGTATVGQWAEQLVKAGGTDLYPWDLRCWPGKRLALASRQPPEPTYLIAWDETVDLSYDPSKLYSQVRVAYTDAATSAPALTDWYPADATTFRRQYGLVRETTIPASGVMAATIANQWAAALARQANAKQWSGTVTREGGAGLRRVDGGETPPWRVRSGEGVQVIGGPLLIVTRTDYTSDNDRLSVSVGSGALLEGDALVRAVQAAEAFRAGRNPLTAAVRS